MPAFREQNITDLIGQIYECAGQLENDGWQSVFERISGSLECGPGSLHFFIKEAQTFERLADTNEPSFQQDFRTTYFQILPFRDHLLKLKAGEVMIRSRACPDRRFAESQLYQEHFRDLGIYYVMHHNLADAGEANFGITLTRPEDHRDFDEADMQAYMQVAPHLQRAVRLHIDLLRADSKSRFYEAAWDRSPQAMILVNETFEIEFRNQAALQYFEDGHFLIEGVSKLACPRAEDSRNLQAMISSVFTADTASELTNGGQYQLRSGDTRPLSLLVAPYLETTSFGFVQRKAVIFIGDPRNKNGSPTENLCKLYGLTVSEGRLANLLAEGNSIREIAEILSISENTARTHLKRIFSKTDTNRQAELVKLILKTPNAYTTNRIKFQK